MSIVVYCCLIFFRLLKSFFYHYLTQFFNSFNQIWFLFTKPQLIDWYLSICEVFVNCIHNWFVNKLLFSIWNSNYWQNNNSKLIFNLKNFNYFFKLNTNEMKQNIYCSFISLNLLTALLTAAAAVVEKTHAPPATVFLQALHFQIPTQLLFIASFPQKAQVYLECCVISIFLTIFLRDAPYLVPYFPTTPTFFVLFAII